MPKLFYRFRSLIIVLCFALGLALPFAYNLTSARAERLDGQKITHDLDKKNKALAAEEEVLLKSLGDKSNTTTLAEADTGNGRASINLNKIADAIVHADTDTTPTATVKAIPAKVISAETSLIEKAEDDLLKEQKHGAPTIQREVVREIIRESDPALKEEVTAMGNLFGEWRVDFEQKHEDVLLSQKKSARELQDRIQSLEIGIAKRGDDSSGTLLALRQELNSQREALENSRGALNTRLENLSETVTRHSATLEEQIKNMSKDYSQTNALLNEQTAALKALRLADGQLKHRMNTSEGEVSNAVQEIGSVKESVNRIETNLAQLSEQFLDSLKYRPHAIYQAPPEWSDEEYDWGEPNPKYTYLPHNAVMSDMPLVTVTETSANLWSGPEEDDKIVTTIRRGGQLAVEATEHDWYRVILADGRRAWIPARSVIHNNPSGRDTTLRIASAH